MAGFENPELLALLVLALPGLYFGFRNSETYGRAVALTHSLVIVLLVTAAASPFVTAQESRMKQPELVVLKDESLSTEVLEEHDLELEGVRVREKVIASGNSSDLQQGILRNLEQDRTYLAVSDFQSSSPMEDTAEKFRRRNSTLNALKVETREEASVEIKGPSSTVPGAENRFRIEVSSTGPVPEPAVKLDGGKVSLERTGNKTWSFRKTFDEKGSHTLEASIDVEDHFSQNNRYYHSIEVSQKPEILVVGQKGGMGRELDEFYDVTHSRSLPDDLSKYYTVILKKDPSREPVEYVSRGNGLVYTGDYEKELDILPVKTVPEGQQNKGAKIMLAIDISRGTEEGGASKRIKQVAFNLVEKLPFNNRVGAVAYNRNAHLMERPEPLSSNRRRLKNRIARLEPSGPSFHHNGLKGARKVLNGTGNIILVTDGRIGGLGENRDVESRAKSIASNLEVRLITVGAGEDRRPHFLQDLADRGNGFYLDAEDSGRLKFRFKSGGASGKTVPLVVVNPNHFITEGIEMDSSSTFFDPVEPRTGSQLLVTGTSGKPFLTTWRYGLGKVAAFSGGDRDLSQVSTVDPLVLTRTVSWSVGDPKRKRDRWIQVETARRPEKVELRASYRIEGFKRQGENLYTATLEPGELGFHSVKGKVYGYNYNSEIQRVGYSEKMQELVRSTGGEVYTPGEKQQMKKEIQSFSQQKIVTKKPVSSYFLVAALLVFLSEVGYRKMKGKK